MSPACSDLNMGEELHPEFPGFLRPARSAHQEYIATTAASSTECKLVRGQRPTLRCLVCSSDIAFASQIVSKGFTGRHGRAFLVAPASTLHLGTVSTSNGMTHRQAHSATLMNTIVGRAMKRELLTGQHVVADISCAICKTVLGWKYVDAKEPFQGYKIGKFILERKYVGDVADWEDAVVDMSNIQVGDAFNDSKEAVQFDSQDEDECEDLFAGIWNADLAAKRRRAKLKMQRKTVTH